jgi:hypothetical protein
MSKKTAAPFYFLLKTIVSDSHRHLLCVSDTVTMTSTRNEFQVLGFCLVEAISKKIYIFFSSATQKPSSSPDRHRLRFLHHTQAHATGRTHLNELVAEVFLYTTNTRDKHPCLQRNLNPRFPHTYGCRPTP